MRERERGERERGERVETGKKRNMRRESRRAIESDTARHRQREKGKKVFIALAGLQAEGCWELPEVHSSQRPGLENRK